MTADKRLLFEFPVPESKVSLPTDESESSQLFRDHLLSKSHVLKESQSLTALRPGSLILHTLTRSITFAQSQQLASLARLTHERHYDIRKFDKKTEIYVPAGTVFEHRFIHFCMLSSLLFKILIYFLCLVSGLVLGLTMSATNRDLHESLHEEVVNVSYVHHLHPGDVVGAFSYISHVNENLPGDLESVTVRTIGVKNMDVMNDLQDVSIPMELLLTEKTYTKSVDSICKSLCPKLHSKIVAVVDRKVIRQSNRREVFLL